MKKIKSLLLLVLVFGFLFVIAGCSKKPEASRVTIDVNPSFELIVDEEKKVVSVTALNDDASVLLYGELIVGKDIEDATEIIMNLTIDAGYLDDETEQKVSISVSGDNSFQRKLEKKVSGKIEDILDESGIKATIEKHEALAIEKLREVVLANSTYTKEEVDKMNEDQLLIALKVSRIETAELLNEEMRKLYFEAKNYEISFAEKEETAKAIENLGSFYSLVHASYVTALDGYRKAISDIENLKYELLISSESTYQKTLKEVLDAKTNYLEQKKYVATLDTGSVKVEAEVKLENLKTIYDNLLKVLEEVGNSASKAFDSVIVLLKQAEVAFTKIEEMFDDNIKETLMQNATNLEVKINELKNSFFAKFEEEHKDDINAYMENLKKQKEVLKNQIK